MWGRANRQLLVAVTGLVLLAPPTTAQLTGSLDVAGLRGPLAGYAASAAPRPDASQSPSRAAVTPPPLVVGGTVDAKNIVPEIIARAPLADVEASISQLDRQLASANARVEAARDQLAIVDVDRARLRDSVALTQARIEALRAELAETAIASYIQPRSGVLELLGGERDPNANARREGLLGTLVESHARAVDRLQELRQDLLSLEGALADADEQVAGLQEQTDSAQAQAAASAMTRATLSSVLAARVARLEAESLGHEQGRAELLRILTQADLAAEVVQAEVAAEEAAEEAYVFSRWLSWPIDAWITSEFGTRWGRMHWGVDFESDYGVPIYASREGTVLEADWMSGYGLAVVIDHGGGLSTLYAHQEELNVNPGQWVERGELIGWVGTTGNSTGPHLHFEVHEGTEAVNPRDYLG